MASAEVLILDNDAAGVTVNPAGVYVTEGTSVTYDVVLDTAPTGNVTVTVSGGDSEVTFNPSTLTFTTLNWATEQTVTVNATDDTDIEGQEEVSLTHAVSGYGSVTAAPYVRVVVRDNDGLSVSDDSATEGTDATLDFVVTLRRPAGVTGTVTVDYTTSDGTGWADEDYTAVSGTLTFTGSDTSKTVQVPVIDDNVEDSAQTMTLNLNNATGSVGIGNAVGVGTIFNTEVPEDAPAQLTATFRGAPSGHDGKNAFTFTLAFSAEVKLSYKTLEQDVFDLSGGAITAASRQAPGSNLKWNITVAPDGVHQVTATLPVTTDCNAQGAVCTAGGNMLSSALRIPIPGPPNNPATGAPTVSGSVRVGELLTASTADIADGDGLNGVSYSFQWLADGTAISGATSSTYTPPAAQQGKAIRVRVSFRDNVGHRESLTSAATEPVAAPTPLTATFSGAPESHDGSEPFAFELRFSENVRLSYKDLRDHGFQVTGGEVTRAKRLEKPSNVRWDIHVLPHGDSDVTVTLPPTTDCDDPGAVCTAAGQRLTGSVTLTVNGPS